MLRSADFNDGSTQAFAVDSGAWSVRAARCAVDADRPHGRRGRRLLPRPAICRCYYEIAATISAVKPTGGKKANAYVIFDYFSPHDFKFAGINVSTNKFEMGTATPRAGTWSRRPTSRPSRTGTTTC